MGRPRVKPKADLRVIDLETASLYGGYAITWLANIASLYLIGKRLEFVKKEDLEVLCQRANEYVASLRSERTKSAAKQKPRDVCEDVPLLLTNNDRPELFRLCDAVALLCDASRGKVDLISLPPALSVEFAEHVRTFMPRATTATLKREVVKVASHVHALAVLGAHISYAYEIREDRGRAERSYVYIDVINPADVDLKKLHAMAKAVTSSVMRKDGSRLALLCGVASAVVLNYGAKILSYDLGLRYENARFTGTGKKVMLKAFETVDITGLAKTIAKLGLAGPLYGMTSSYPQKDFRNARSFVERLSKAIMIYHSLHTLEEVYSTLRALSSERLLDELRGAYGDDWSRIYDGLLGVRV